MHRPVPPLPPGTWLGLLGGGQLGRMFCFAAQSLGYKVCVLDPGADSPAGSVADRHLRADYLDAAALDELARSCGAATTEFENVPAQALERLARDIVVAPRASAVAIAQDRIAEKAFVVQAGIEVAPYRAVLGEADLRDAEATLFPAILKAARLGYDGKGQARVADRAAALEAFRAMGGVPCVLEQRLPLALEVSVLVARGFDGEARAWPVAENEHRGGILALSTVPARVDVALAARATDGALAIAAALDYVGVLCVEFFVLDDGRLVVNELAPRPHNSGHWTIDACVTSQFEQQARVLAGLPLGGVRQHSPAVMVNLLGDVWFRGTDRAREPDWAAVLGRPQAKLHLYGKAEARPGRKMGHVTVVGETADEAVAVAAAIERDLGIAR
ncbi:MAG: 5-(carboxyamino)imidazole ribonucleotide synthase [Burkholderiales bacterium]|nr:5-(carboxyamino)imidazole ribonucleotide synthase [Burkholderiales bacterium]